MSDELSTPAAGRAISRPVRRLPWWQRPLLLSVVLTLLMLVALLGWPLLRAMLGPPPVAGAVAESGMPWQVDPLPQGGSQVFGLALGTSRLGAVQARFPEGLNVAIVLPTGQAPALEAYSESFRAGFVTGKLVMAFEMEPGWLERALGRAPGHDIGDGGRSRRFKLAPEDLADAADRARLVAMGFVPSARLDEAVVVQRFGQPGERVTGPGGELQLLYPVTGVAVVLPPAEGEAARAKPVIQYVAPGQFEARVRGPLLTALAASAPASASSR